MFNCISDEKPSSLSRSIGSNFGCLIVRVANVDGQSQWRVPSKIKVFNSVSPEMKAKRQRRADSALVGYYQHTVNCFNKVN